MSKFLKLLIAIIISPVALIFVIFVRIISPFIIIRWHNTISTRIGHFAENLFIYICEKNIGLHKIKNKVIIDIFYTRSKICNNQLFKMWKRKIFFFPSLFMHVVNFINEKIFNLIFRTNLHDIGYYRDLESLKIIENNSKNVEDFLLAPLENADPLNALDNSSFELSFTKEEKDFGEKKLKDFGIDTKKKMVNILLRDMEYLKKHYSINDWSYHDIRYSPYSFYKEAAEKLAELDYTVIVIGASKKDFNRQSINPSIIDYSNSSLKSDFMDIYINYCCDFAISSANGLDAIPIIFKKPVIEVAVVPIEYVRAYSKNMKIMFKTYYSKTLRRKLNLKEIFELGLYNSIDSLSDEIKLIHPSSEEILDAAMELTNKDSENTIEEISFKELENNFKRKYSDYCVKFNAKRRTKIFSASVGKLFLKNNKYLLDNN